MVSESKSMVSDPRAKFISWYHDLDFQTWIYPKTFGVFPQNSICAGGCCNFSCLALAGGQQGESSGDGGKNFIHVYGPAVLDFGTKDFDAMGKSLAQLLVEKRDGVKPKIQKLSSKLCVD